MVWLLLFLTCVGYEAWSWLNHKPMLTQVVVRYIPAPVTLLVLAWLFVHFLVRYSSPTYRAWVRSGGAGG